VIDPPTATQRLQLFLYADGPSGVDRTIDDYANIQVYGFPTPFSHLAILAEPADPRDAKVTVDRTSYSIHWLGPSGSTHVLVDGLTNGWIETAHKPVRPRYAATSLVNAGSITSLAGVVALTAVVGRRAVRRRQVRPRGRGQ
jgi:hypothetical protein